MEISCSSDTDDSKGEMRVNKKRRVTTSDDKFDARNYRKFLSSRKTIKADDVAVNHIENVQTTLLKEEGRTESISPFSMERTEEDGDVAGSEESHLQTKNFGEHDGCVICMLGGELLCCDGTGCQRRYHLSCLDPPIIHAPFGVWHCVLCVKRKMDLGVHSVSEGVDSIWDVREVALDHEGKQMNKEYLVKYQGLAHVHNRWISEAELLLEAPKLVAKFNRRIQLTRWKTEWTVPQRLLHKRWLSFAKHPDYDNCGNSDCRYEWLVKWTGLGYEHATWELENASFFTSSRAMELIEAYESRHDKAETLPSISQVDEEGQPNISFLYAYQPRKANFSRLSELSSGDSSGAYNNYLNYVKKLCEHWHKGENAIIVDDQVHQERIVKVILFILSLQCTVLRPFLIISSANVLSVWEEEFLHVAPSVNFIVYKGSKDVRSGIRSSEFYSEGGKIMFQVLLTSSNIVVEDLEVLKSIAWRALIVDECHRFSISKHFKLFKMIAADRRLLVSSQVKDCSADYINMLSLLDYGVDDLNIDDSVLHSSTSIAKLKERFAPYIAYECKSNSLEFVEYWVPVWLSNVQLEQYCSLLLSNPVLLYSCLKNDHFDALQEIIISVQKCCDHPYLLDQSLQRTVRKDLPIEKYLDVEIQMSGKLLALDKLLLAINSQGLRALIVFQSLGGSGRNSVGDNLEDIVRQRFGKDCYVRIDGVNVHSKKQKQAALNMFNSKGSGRFIFLIENRACLPSIKLSSVDIIILFDSDWNPQNDLRALQKITINSQFKRLKIFRLYLCCTIEEMVLKLAKEGATVEGVDTINRNVCRSLLSWGMPHLFNRLDEFHQCKTFSSGSNIYSEWLFLDNVVRELSDQLHCTGENDPGSNSFISKAPHNAGEYSRHIQLRGEKEVCLMETEPPFLFCKNLLDGRCPQWHFLSESSPRSRIKIKYVNNSLNESEIEKFDVVKKSQIVVNNLVDPVYKKKRLNRKRKLLVANKESKFSVRGITRVPQVKMVESEKQNISPSVLKKSQSSPLKLEIMQLCDALKLPENVKSTSVILLEYIMDNFNVSLETTHTSQAFQISLCWTAAALLKYKIDHNELLVLAKLHLKFDCKEDEANYIHSKLQNLKKEFGRHVKTMKIAKKSNHGENSKSTSSEQQDLEEELTVGSESQSLSAGLVGLEAGERSRSENPASYSKSARLDRQYLEGGKVEPEAQKRDYSSSQTKMPQENDESLQLTSRVMEEEALKADDQMVQLKKAVEKIEIEGEAQRLNVLDNLLDLEEGEIRVCSNHTNSLEEGGITANPHSCNHLDQTRPETMEQKSDLKRLNDSLEDNRDESGSQSEMPLENLQTLQLTSMAMDEQLEANGQIVQLEKAMKKPEIEREAQSMNVVDNLVDLEEGEITICSNWTCSSLEEGEIPASPHSHSHLDKTVSETMEQKSALERLNDSLEDKRDDFSSQTGMPQENLETLQLTWRVMKEQLNADDQIVQSEKAMKKPDIEGESQRRNVSGNLVDLEGGEIRVCSNHTSNLEEGEIPVNLHSRNHLDQTLPETIEHNSALERLRGSLEDKRDYSGSQMGMPPENLETLKLTSRVMEEQLNADEQIVQLEKAMKKPEIEGDSQRQNVSDSLVDLEGREIRVCSNHTNNLEEGEIPVSPNSCNHLDQTLPGTMEQHSALEKLHDSLEDKRDGSGRQMEMPQENIEILQLTSRVMDEQLKGDDRIVQLDKAMKIPLPSSGSPCLSDSESKIDTMQPTDTSTMLVCSQSGIPETNPSLPSHCESVPTVPQETSDHEKELSRSQVGTVTIVIESDSKCDEVETNVLRSGASASNMHIYKVNGSAHGLKNGAPESISVERQNPDNNGKTIDSVIRPSKDRQRPVNETVMVDEPMHCSTQAVHIQSQSGGMESTNVSEVRQDNKSVVCTGPPPELTGTSPSVVQPHISAVHKNLIPLHQPPIPSVSFCASAQEVQFSRQPMVQHPMEFANPSIRDSPLPPSTSMQMGGSDLHFHQPRSRTNVHDFRSMAVGPIHPPLHANRLMPESPQLACYDPLHIEMERIKKDDEQDFKMLEQTILNIKSERDREIEEVLKKYDPLLQDAERTLLQKRRDHRIKIEKVHMSKLLAAAVMLNQSYYIGAETPDTRIVPTSHPTIPSQRSAIRLEQYPPTPMAASSAEVINQPSLVLSNGSVRPFQSTMGGIMRELQNGYELQGSAPLHRASILQFLMSPVHMPLPVPSYGVQNQHLP